MAKLHLESVSYIYPGAERTALEDISLSVESDEFVVILGANGSGKSTLGRIAAGLLEPTSGNVFISGVDNHEGWNNVGMLHQNPDNQLLMHSVESELAWGLENIGLPRDLMQRRVAEIMRMFELESLKEAVPDSLSDGWKQLLALASLVVMRPVFLVLDEVTGFLDPYWTKKIRRMCRDMLAETGRIWITTDTVEAREADRVVILDRGRIFGLGKPEEVLKSKELVQIGLGP